MVKVINSQRHCSKEEVAAHLPVVQRNAAVLEGRAVQRERLILATLTTHVAAKPVP